jgi:hypothetical protein
VPSARNSRETRRQALQKARQEQARRKRQQRIAIWAGVAVVLAGAGVGIGLGLSGSGSGNGSSAAGSTASTEPLSTLGTLQPAPAAGALGPEQVPIPTTAPVLAATSPSTTGQTIDGMSCTTSEQTVFHIHTHLTIFVNGQPRQVPAGIGIPGAVLSPDQGGQYAGSGTCFYWLHTHAADGIIHIESPVNRAFTLGNFFDEWGQPLSADQVGPAKGKVTVLINGRVFTGDPRNAPLGSHENLQVEVGNPLVAPETINWSNTGL